MQIPVFDLHCDTALALLGESMQECGSLKKNSGHIDLDRASQLAGYAQCFACFTTEPYREISPVELFEREMVSVLREVEKNSDTIQLAYNTNDIENNYKNGKMSAILTIEGTAGIGYDPDLLPDLYAVGFRMTTLGWNENNKLTGSCVTGGGLTDLGRIYVENAQQLGMLVDVSHISDEAFWDIMDITTAPVIASHSNSRFICNKPRNLTDEMFVAICKSEGVAGMNLYTDFVGAEATLDTLCDHIFHFLELDPDGKHIALGGDLDGCDKLVRGLNGINDYNTLAEHLLKRGVGESTLYNLFWNNALGVMKRCCI